MHSSVATFYRFVDLPDCADWKEKLQTRCEAADVLGTLILAPEGINATLAGPKAGIDAVLTFIRADKRFTDMPHRECITDHLTFHRLRIILRDEIVTLGNPSINPNEAVGEYVPPEEWNELINDPEVTVIDTRNNYEVELGSFQGALDPQTAEFGEWPEYVKKNLDPAQHKKIAMFCTGGIRCEKASAHLLKEGFEQVYHLQGGILNYLQNTPAEDSLWEGECFVFDHRVSVTHGLERGECETCFGCRWPIQPEDLQSSEYEPGICCPRCADTLTPERRARLEERHRQVVLARFQNKQHIGQKVAKK
jgi:UPF0176 protein